MESILNRNFYQPQTIVILSNTPNLSFPILENPKFCPPSNCLWLFETLKESEHLTRTPRFLNSVPRATVSWLCDKLKESEPPCHNSQLREDVRLRGTATICKRRDCYPTSKEDCPSSCQVGTLPVSRPEVLLPCRLQLANGVRQRVSGTNGPDK